VLSWTFVAVGVITILQQHILQTHHTPHTTLPSNMPTAVPESNRGSNATITMSREDLMSLSVKKLKHLLKERDLPAGPPQVVARLSALAALQHGIAMGLTG